MVVENAFGKLKGRWRCLLKRLDVKFENVVHVTAACVVLHNLCEKHSDYFNNEWNVDNNTTTRVPTVATSSTDSTTHPAGIRNAIKDFLASDQ